MSQKYNTTKKETVIIKIPFRIGLSININVKSGNS